jgi:hypothetical protein
VPQIATRLVPGGVHALEHVLLRDRAERHGGERGDPGDDLDRVQRGQELELAFGRGLGDHVVEAARHVAGDPAHPDQADHDHDHLHEGGHRHRPHATEQGIDEDDAGAEQHALVHRHRVAREHVEHQPERGDLRRHPAQVGEHDADRQHELGRAVVAHAEEIAQREQVHAVQRAGEDEAEQHQAGRGAERVGDQAVEAFLEEGGGDAEHGLGAEPGGEHHRQHDDHRQVAPCGDVVTRIVHPGGGIQADADGDDQVGDDKPEQHGWAFRVGASARGERKKRARVYQQNAAAGGGMRAPRA